jgi:hypothetical protein
MNATQIVTAICSLISLAGLWIILFWLYRGYRTDQFRQATFALRDELFDAASDRKIDFSHPAYCLLRSTMNGFIRFGHRFTLLQVLLMVGTRSPESPNEDDSFSVRWERAVRDLDQETLLMLTRVRLKMNILVLRHVVLSSPFLVVSIIAPVAGWFAIKFCLSAVLRVLRTPLDDLDSVALAEGTI